MQNKLKIYNSLKQTKEDFKPLVEGKASLYVCGITVYDYCHIGHARVFVFFDTVARHLKKLGYDTKFVRNITDVDDKIINRANENKLSISDLTEKYIKAMHEDMQRLGIKPVSLEPKATEYIDEILSMIQVLIDKNIAYISKSGDVLYNVDSFSEYGKLSNQTLDNLKAGARVAVSADKKDPLDFVLWKLAKEGEPSWNSPWGDGRPGWHIECSAMATNCLGDTFDIHGGGHDLLFPHHENEIAQSEATTGKQYVNTWMHVGFVQVDKEKMSKSLNNFFTIREVLSEYHPEVIRYFLLSGHYRKPINYSIENLTSAKNSLDRLYTSLRGASINNDISIEKEDLYINYLNSFNNAMNDDFNTPESLVVLFEIAKELNLAKENNDYNKINILAYALKSMADTLGLLAIDVDSYFKSNLLDDSLSSEVEKLIKERDTAKKSKDYVKADEIRAKLTSLGVVLEDTKDGTIWKKV